MARAAKEKAKGGGAAVGTTRRCFNFSSRIFPACKGWAVFPLLSLANHSCDPNCEVAFIDSNMVRLLAQREIEAGEELSISYVDVTQPTEVRRRKLQARYGFHCVCPRCTADDVPSSKAKKQRR